MCQLISGNIANIIPRSAMNKMVPLMESSGRGARSPILAHGLMRKYTCTMHFHYLKHEYAQLDTCRVILPI